MVKKLQQYFDVPILCNKPLENGHEWPKHVRRYTMCVMQFHTLMCICWF